jgi:hypothetical protein
MRLRFLRQVPCSGPFSRTSPLCRSHPFQRHKPADVVGFIVFIVFFGVWRLTAYAVLQMASDSGLVAIAIGFAVGIVATRAFQRATGWLFKKASGVRINICR